MESRKAIFPIGRLIAFALHTTNEKKTYVSREAQEKSRVEKKNCSIDRFFVLSFEPKKALVLLSPSNK